MSPAPDPWSFLKAHTAARIAIGRVGSSVPTREVLAFALSHAKARDAVHARLDRTILRNRITALDLQVVEVESRARDRAVYLVRPDLGRQLDVPSRQRLARWPKGADVLFMIGDGLSATAVMENAVPVVAALVQRLAARGHMLGPVVLAEGARVALGDEVGSLLGTKLVVMFIGERPGLSAADSLSAYVTFAPRPGRTDAERNCVSNIRQGGLAPEAAAGTIAWLVEMALDLRLSGTALKDGSAIPALGTR